MFEKLAQLAQQLQNSQSVDPARFGDPVAVRTGWKPISGGSSNICSNKLVIVNPDQVKYKTTIGAIIFALIFALPGIGLLILLIPNVDWFSLDTGLIVGLSLGLVFASLGGYMFYRQMLPIVFDKQEGLFWKHHKPQTKILAQEATAKYARLELIHALQILAKHVSGKSGGYISYELNLVLKDGYRINVVDLCNRNKLAEDVEVLTEFLGVPIWDATINSPFSNTFPVTR